MQSHILHVISKSHPLWQVHAQSHLTRHIKIPPPLASTCAVTSYITRPKSHPLWQAKHIQSHILRFVWKSHPLWQVHAQSHLTRHIKNPTPSGKYMQSHILQFVWKSHPLWQVHAQSHLTRRIKIRLILHVISKSHPLWQVHAQSHLTRHIKIPPPVASTCTVSSYTSYQNPTPSGKYMHSLILHVISKSHPLWQVHAQSHLNTSYPNPTPCGTVHAQSHLTRHITIPPPLASTCTVTSYITRSKSHPLWQAHTKSHLTVHIKNPTPSGKYMHSLILHVISKSHPLWQVHAQSHLTVISKSHLLWQVHAQSHLTRHIKLPPPLASTYKVTSYSCMKIPPPLAGTCTVSSYTSDQNPSHLTRHIKIPPPLASTCAVSSYTSYENPTPSGKYMHSLILHVISKSHPLWQVHAQSHLTRHIKIPPPVASTCTVSSYTSYQNPTPSGKYMHSLILHVISKSHPLWQAKHIQSHILRFVWKSHPLWQVHAQSHLTRHIKIRLILHVIWKSYPLLQVHAQSHLTRRIKIPPPLASTCKVTSYTSYENPTPSGKYMHSLILHVIWKSHPLWQVHAQSHLTRHIKIPPREKGSCSNPPIRWSTRRSQCMNSYIWFTKHSLRAMFYESWFTKHSLRAMVYRSRSQPEMSGDNAANKCWWKSQLRSGSLAVAWAKHGMSGQNGPCLQRTTSNKTMGCKTYVGDPMVKRFIKVHIR